MNRTLCGLSAGALLIVLTACTQGAPAGATLPPLSTSAVAATETSPPATTTPDPTSEPDATTTTQAPPVDVTIPAEASALPLPTAQVDIPADNPQEEADRAAIESVWRQVWNLYRDGYELSPAEVRATADRLLAEPVRSQFINGLTSGRERGVGSYGTISLHPYWYQPVGGSEYAVLGDCADYSQYGELDRSTGEKTTVGDKNSNRTAQFVKDSAGNWHLWNFTRTPGLACTSP